MTVRMTIIGLGQIGASIGLALKENQEMIYRVGHDLDRGVARKAKKMGAVDKVMGNLPSSVRESDIVLLALPMDQIKETIEIISQDLKDDAVLMDTGPVKKVMASWTGELLPDKCHYVGLTPVINPDYLDEIVSGIDAARSDLFINGLVAITAPPNTDSNAIKLASDLIHLLGADSLFADPLEVDGLMATTHILPQLMASALINATVDQPGWREGRKIAGRAYAEMTGPITHLSDSGTLGQSALLNRENVVRVLDTLTTTLQSLRNDIDNQDREALESNLEHAHKGRQQWWQERWKADWIGEEITSGVKPSLSSDIFRRLIGFGRRPKKEKDG